jgi:hypothetical protein
MSDETTISLLVNIPPDIHEPLREYLDRHPSFDQDAVFAEALHEWLVKFTVDLALEK